MMKKLPVPAIILVLGLIAMWFLGRWDARISAKELLHQQRVEVALKAGRAWRAHLDSLRVQETAALRRAATAQRESNVLAGQVDSMEVLGRQRATQAVSGDLAAVVAVLGMVQVDDSTFGTDSAGVRMIALWRVDAQRARTIIPTLRSQLRIQVERATAFRTAGELASQRAEAAELRVVTLEELLEEDLKLHRCRIMGFVPCPSRTVSFVGGVALTAIAAVALSVGGK